ncbi:MAG: LptF/LptG family permease, partial [Acidobacteriota bacterium]
MSVYRVLAPCFALVLGLGVINFFLQETVLPETNQRQDALRTTLRSKGLPHNAGDRSWSATGNRIYSFDTPELGGRVEADVGGIYAYEFGIDGRINAVYRATSGLWDGTRVKISGSAERLTFRDALINREVVNESTIAEAAHPFSYANQKPSHLNSFETWQHAAASESENEKRNLSVALNRKLATPFIPLILVLFSVPFAISIGRRKNIFVVSYAVGIWLVFTGATSFFEQSGQGGLLGPIAAIWSPIILFGALGLFLTSKIKT